VFLQAPLYFIFHINKKQVHHIFIPFRTFAVHGRVFTPLANWLKFHPTLGPPPDMDVEGFRGAVSRGQVSRRRPWTLAAGSWNVTSLRNKQDELVDEAKRYRLDIVGVS